LSGIYIEISSYSQVYYNVSVNHTHASEGMGIRVSGRTGSVATNNAIYNNVSYGNLIGIAISGQESGPGILVGNLVKNNVAVGNVYQLYAIRGGENDGTVGSGNIYTYNCFGAEASNFIVWGDGVGKATYASWETTYGGTTHSAQSDPLFVSAAGSNFRLTSASPAKDTGTPVGLSRDFIGTSVPLGAGVDMGAYEYGVGIERNGVSGKGHKFQ
jgi:hypothetical protein